MLTSDLNKLKSLVISAIESLPDEIPSNLNESGEIMFVENISARKKSDLLQINEADELQQLFGNYKVIALIGSIKAGKSSIGNILLGKKSSECFIENVNTETAIPKFEKIDEKILIDLPGLSSVIDQHNVITQKYISRADVFLVVQDITRDIDEQLYDFLKSLAKINQKTNQKIVIVLNKSDGIVPQLLEHNINKHKNWILKGKPDIGFEGVQDLFNYEITFLTFSVVDYRDEKITINNLVDNINQLTNNTGINRTEKFLNEILAVNKNWEYVSGRYETMLNTLESNRKKSLETKKRLFDKLNQLKLFEQHVNSLRNTLQTNYDVLVLSLTQLKKPSLLDKGTKFMFGKSEKYNSKKQAVESLREDTVEKMTTRYNSDLKTFSGSVTNTVNEFFYTDKPFKISNTVQSIFDAYFSLANLTIDHHLGEIFDEEEVKNYEGKLRVCKSDCAKGYNETLRSYINEIKKYIDEVVENSLKKYDNLQSHANKLITFYNYQSQIKQIVNGGPEPQPQSSNNIGIIIAIIFIIIIIIVIFSIN